MRFVALCLLVLAVGVMGADRKHIQRKLHVKQQKASLRGDSESSDTIETEFGIEHTTVVDNALEAFKAEMDQEAAAHGITPFWGRTPECCLGRGRLNQKKSIMERKCTVYTIWMCFPIGAICEDPKPKVEPKPVTYTVHIASGVDPDAALGDYVCNSNCKKCEKPRKNDISSRILGSLKED